MKKSIIVIVIVVVILSIVTIILTKEKNKNHKTLSEHDYIIEKETDFTNDKYVGKLPIINLNSRDVQLINNKIMKEYYECAYGEDDIFYYEYYVYKDVLSLFIRITRVDNTEYGTIDYYIYNINVKTEKELSNDELLEYLNIPKEEVNKKINERLKKYYDVETLKDNLTYEGYLSSIEYKEDNNKLVIIDKKLYLYTTFKLTRSLVEYNGNINEIEITELK